MSSLRYNNSKNSSYRKRGGNGAADYAQSVYGGPGEQKAGVGNEILATQVRNGGARRGGNVVNDIAVPAALLYANYAYSKNKGNPYYSQKTFRRKGRKGSRRRRSTRRTR